MPAIIGWAKAVRRRRLAPSRGSRRDHEKRRCEMNARSKMNRRWTLVTATAVVAVLAVGGGVALATIPGSGGAISGCYAKKDGSLLVIDLASASCKSTETALIWKPGRAAGPARRRRPARAERRSRRSRTPGPEGRHRPRRPAGPAGAAGVGPPSERTVGQRRHRGPLVRAGDGDCFVPGRKDSRERRVRRLLSTRC